MAGRALDELLTTLDVKVHAVAVCEVRRGYRLVFDPMTMVSIHYVLQGSGLMHVRGQEPTAFAEKSVLIVPPGGQVTLGLPEDAAVDVPADRAGRMSDDGMLVFNAGEGATELLIAAGTITATYAGGFGLFDHLEDPLVEDVAEVKLLAASIDELLRETCEPGLGSRAFTEAIMRQCLLLILRSHFARVGEESPLFAALRDPRLVRAISAVLSDPGGRHSLETLAKESGMSRSVFVERFSQAFQQTPFEFVQKVRLRHAAHLLRATDLPVKMIAETAGFASRSHFSRVFRSAFEIDPRGYRNQRQNADAMGVPFATAPANEAADPGGPGSRSSGARIPDGKALEPDDPD